MVAILTAALVAMVGIAPASAAAREVSGRLVSDSGAPLAGFKVRAVPAAGYGSVGSSRAVTTDVNGNFHLPMPKAGSTFLLEAFDPARTSGANKDDRCVEPARTQALTTFIGSRGKQTFSKLDPITGYKARSKSSIRSGVHRLASSSGFDLAVPGVPADAVRVSVLRKDGVAAYTPGCGALDHGFVPGSYTLKVEANGFAPVSIPTTLKRGELEKRTVTLAERPMATVRGAVTSAGTPRSWDLTITGPGVDISIPNTRSYSVSVPADVPLSITRDDGIGHSDVRFPAGTTTTLDLTDEPTSARGVIEGRFLANGKHKPWRDIELRSPDGDVVAEMSMRGAGAYRSFRLGARPGTYRLVWVDGANHVFSYTTVRISAGETTQFGDRAATRKTAKLWGDSTLGLRVRIVSGKTEGATALSWGETRYRLENLIPGTYKVRFDRIGYVSKVVTVNVRTSKRLTPPKLAKRSPVKGTIVYAANGRPVAHDSQVRATMTSKRTGDVARRSSSSRDARLVIGPRDVTAGKYAVELSAPGRSTASTGCVTIPSTAACIGAQGVNAWRSPYYWDGREVFRYKAGSNNLGTVKVHLRGGL